jgi:hypothetical protein
MKSMNMYGIYLFRKKKMGYILYSKNINALHICPPKRNKLFKQTNENQGFGENMNFYLQHTGQSHSFDENLK